MSWTSEIIEPPGGQLGTAMSLEGLNNPTSAPGLGIAIRLASEIIEPPRHLAGYTGIHWEGLNNPTSEPFVGIGSCLASEIIEPPRQARPYTYSEGAVPERLNNPTSERAVGID